MGGESRVQNQESRGKIGSRKNLEIDSLLSFDFDSGSIDFFEGEEKVGGFSFIGLEGGHDGFIGRNEVFNAVLSMFDGYRRVCIVGSNHDSSVVGELWDTAKPES